MEPKEVLQKGQPAGQSVPVNPELCRWSTREHLGRV